MTKQNKEITIIVSNSITMGTLIWMITSIFVREIMNPFAITIVLMSSILSSLSTYALKEVMFTK